MENIKLSIIIPCYNEGDKVLNNIIKIENNLKLKNINYEIIIVNDGSTDNTKEALSYFSEESTNNYISIINYDQNKGKGYAIKTGIEKAIGEWVLFMDADLSTDIIAIDEVLRNMGNYDVIIGSRHNKDTILKKKQGITRTFIGRVCNILTNLIVPLKLSDTQCGFKAFEGTLAKNIIKKQKINRFAFDVEYLYISKLNKKNILEIPIIWENDEDSKVSIVRSSFSFLKDLIKIRLNKKKYFFKS